jgi:hypothetical protein
MEKLVVAQDAGERKDQPFVQFIELFTAERIAPDPKLGGH